MKKILITAMSLNVGGAEKSLVNFLNMIDTTKYEVDLLIFQKKGAFLKQVPENINIISVKEIEILYQSFKETIKKEKFNIKSILMSIKRYLITLYEKNRWKQFDQIRIHRWIDSYKKIIPQCEKKYDVAISFAGGETAYYIVDKVKSDRKVYFFHSDYSKIKIDNSLEEKYVDKVDQVITISEECKKSLQALFPRNADKIIVLNNLSSVELIKKMSKEFYPKEYSKNDEIKIVSVGRLHTIKGYDMAIEAAHILKKNNINFKWLIVGEGKERKNLEKMITNYNLENEFILVGLKENPYPYIYNSTFLVQPSRFEGKSVVLDEAKILEIPIIVTNYNSVKDQIDHLKNGVIVDMNAQAIAEGIINLMNDKQLLNSIKINLKNNKSNYYNIEEYMEGLCGKED